MPSASIPRNSSERTPTSLEPAGLENLMDNTTASRDNRSVPSVRLVGNAIELAHVRSNKTVDSQGSLEQAQDLEEEKTLYSASTRHLAQYDSSYAISAPICQYGGVSRGSSASNATWEGGQIYSPLPSPPATPGKQSWHLNSAGNQSKGSSPKNVPAAPARSRPPRGRPWGRAQSGRPAFLLSTPLLSYSPSSNLRLAASMSMKSSMAAAIAAVASGQEEPPPLPYTARY
jgi:hypothetical protein